MKASYYLIVSEINKPMKWLLKVKKTVYICFRKRLYKIDKRNNKKQIKNYPVFHQIIRKIKINYVVYGVGKTLRIEDIKPLQLWGRL